MGVSGLGDVASCGQKKTVGGGGGHSLSHKRRNLGPGGCQAQVAADHQLHGVYDWVYRKIK